MRVLGSLLIAVEISFMSALAGQNGQRWFPLQPTGPITDVAHLLDDLQRGALEERLRVMLASKGVDAVIVTLPTVGAQTPADLIHAIQRDWRIGTRVNGGGLIFLLVPPTSSQAGVARAAVGNGLELVLSDLRASEINDSMQPMFRRADYGRTLDVGTRIAARMINWGGNGVAPAATPTSSSQTDGSSVPLTSAQVDEPAAQTGCSAPRYPPSLRTVGVQGSVQLRYVVGVSGRVEPNSMTVVNSTNHAFEQPAIDAILTCRNSPARIKGQPVRQMVEQTVRFTIR